MVEVMAEFIQVEVIEFLVVVQPLEVDEGATVMLFQGDLKRRPMMLSLQISSQYVVDLGL